MSFDSLLREYEVLNNQQRDIPLLPPYDEPYSPLEAPMLGGLALNDSSLGRGGQRWVCWYEDDTIYVGKPGEAAAFSLPVPDVLTVSAAFDGSMNVVLAYTTPAGGFYRFFDPTVPGYVTVAIPGATSCIVAVDDSRLRTASESDAIVVYTLGSNAFYRVQRDRYSIDYSIGYTGNMLALRAGPTDKLRFKIVFGKYSPPLYEEA